MTGRRIVLTFLLVGLLLAAGCAPSPAKLMADAEKASLPARPGTAEIHPKTLLQQNRTTPRSPAARQGDAGCRATSREPSRACAEP
jgi:hypothetical protein